MSTKRSKKKNSNATFIGLSRSALYNLFSPYSKYPLVRYESLRFIDFDQLKLIDTKQLKFIDFAMLSFFLKYTAVLGVFVLMIGGVGFSYLIARTEEDRYKAAHTQAFNNEINRHREYLEEKYNSKLVLLPPEQETEPVVEGNVLGLSDVVSVQETAIPACSFDVNGLLYSSGSNYELNRSTSAYVCARYSRGVETSWYVKGGNAIVEVEGDEPYSDCAVLSNVSNLDTLVVNVFDEYSNLVGACSLSF